jgi:hypothetical protein
MGRRRWSGGARRSSGGGARRSSGGGAGALGAARPAGAVAALGPWRRRDQQEQRVARPGEEKEQGRRGSRGTAGAGAGEAAPVPSAGRREKKNWLYTILE